MSGHVTRYGTRTKPQVMKPVAMINPFTPKFKKYVLPTYKETYKWACEYR